MNTEFIENKIFEKIDYTSVSLAKGEYENCTFKNCIFYSIDLSNIIFRESIFDGCDFSLAKIKNTTLNNIRCVNCKLLGVQFNECNNFLLSIRFDDCLLKLSSFRKLKLKKTTFARCNLQEADFSQADLSNSLFDNCDLHRALFYKTNLEKADFRTAFNYSFDPELNQIKKARFSQTGIIGLLNKYDIEIE